jgi:hypothetical protein
VKTRNRSCDRRIGHCTVGILGCILAATLTAPPSMATSRVGGPLAEESTPLAATLLPAVGDAKARQLAVRWLGEPEARLRVAHVGSQGTEATLVPWHALEPGVEIVPLPLDPTTTGALRIEVYEASGSLLAVKVLAVRSSAETSELTWKSTFVGVGLDDHVQAVAVWDDGSGPALYLGGRFATVGGRVVNHIARWDGRRWSPLAGPTGSGVTDPFGAAVVWALAVYDGHLVAAGSFTSAGGVTVNNIARWDGHQWHPFTGSQGTGVSGRVHALAVHDGHLVAGGTFISAGGVSAGRIARWDGSEWLPLAGPFGSGVSSGIVSALVVHDGDLVVGGVFHEAGGVPADDIARWDGEQWHPLLGASDTGINGGVQALAVHDGDLVAGGWFAEAGGLTVNNIARWDGEQWHPFEAAGGTGTTNTVSSLTVHDGDLVAGGLFHVAGGVSVLRVARWDGEQWHPLPGSQGTGLGTGVNLIVEALTVYQGDLIAGGSFTEAGGVGVDHIARWNSSDGWSALTDLSVLHSAPEGEVFGGAVHALAIFDGDLVAGGWFTGAGGIPVNHIARWDGEQWHPLSGPSGTGASGPVFALKVHDGDLFAGGSFVEMGGIVVNYIARWDGEQWHPLVGASGSGISGPVWDLTAYDGDLVAGGSFTFAGDSPANHIARWDGGEWRPFVAPHGTGVSAPVLALTSDAGNLFAGGGFAEAAGIEANGIARWDGEQWHPLAGPAGTGIGGPGVEALVVYGGDVVAGGSFSQAGGVVVDGIARWDGNQWHPLAEPTAPGFVRRVQALAIYQGDLVAGGHFHELGGSIVNHIARWDGEEWHPLEGPAGTGTNRPVLALAVLGSELAAGGEFSLTGGVVNRRVGLFGPPPEPCQAGPTTLCLDHATGDERFEVTVTFETIQGGGLAGQGTAIPLGSLGVTTGGLVHFGNPANPEILVKVLNGCAINQHHWVFYAATTNIGFTVTVRDTATDELATYSNPDLTPAAPVQDIAAFECVPWATGAPSWELSSSDRPRTLSEPTVRPAGRAAPRQSCLGGDHTLCIADRFQVEIDFETSQAGGFAGSAWAIPLADLGVTSGGLFHFGNQANPEILLKVLEGCAINDHYWVFYGAATNLGFTVTVSDLLTGETAEYENPDLTPADPTQDITALPCSG